jgi:hypothetical protein
MIESSIQTSGTIANSLASRVSSNRFAFTVESSNGLFAPRTLIDLDLPNLTGPFAVVPQEDFLAETLLDISPAMLLVPHRPFGLFKGPYIMVVRDTELCFGRRKISGVCQLLSWLHFRQPSSVVLFGAVLNDELHYQDQMSIEAAFLRLTGPNKWGF